MSAQGGRAEINGTVVDQSQAVLPGATVTVVNAGTGIERVAVTGPDGRFVVPTLVPGEYTVTVELAGFQPQTRENVRVNVGQEVSLDFVLSVGGLAEEVTVSAEAPTVEVTTTRVATNIGNEEIDNLPSQGRNQLSLMQLVPGLTPSLAPGGFNGGEYNANGRDRGSNLFLLDGMSNQQGHQGGSLGGMTRMSLDTMAEFQVLTHQYGAEYGGASGVVVNAVSRAGTNNFNGRTFSYLPGRQAERRGALREDRGAGEPRQWQQGVRRQLRRPDPAQPGVLLRELRAEHLRPGRVADVPARRRRRWRPRTRPLRRAARTTPSCAPTTR